MIHGGYSTKTGVLRRIPSTRHCKSGEKSLNWNGKGIQGIQGVKGDPGPPGADGTTIAGRVRLSSAESFAIPTTAPATPLATEVLPLSGGSSDQAPK